MCSIAGIIRYKQEIDKNLLKQMNIVQRHRGPDDEGYFVDENVGLAHNRLSIIDLSPLGHQPMSNEDGTIWIVYNGEIYNYLEIIPDLKSKGHIFKSKTDTEVIIHAYEEYDIDCLQRLNGMFAFAIWDSRKKQLFCARDRFGIKPFYYYHNDDYFIFASEIKAILEDKKIQLSVNNQILYNFLRYGIINYNNETFYCNIMQLPSAHCLILRQNEISIEKYWDIEPENELNDKSDEFYAEKFHELFEDSIRIHLRSDVPIGTCLSGGIDSSSIVCVANDLLFPEKNLKESIKDHQKTFSSCFEDLRFDERKYINKVIEKTGAETNFIFPSSKDLIKDIDKIIWYQDQPFNSISIFAQWNVMKLASESGVIVLLDGQGADELLAGYPPYFGANFEELARKMALCSLLKERVLYAQNRGYSFLKSIFFALAGSISQIWKNSNKNDMISFQSELPEALSNEGCEALGNLYKPKYFKDILKNRLYYDCIKGYRLSSLLRYEDRNSMAFSLESRVPFLDYRLVEYVFSLPDRCRINKGWTKAVLRNAMKGILPEEIRMRKDKMGFVTPQDVWMRGELKFWINDIFYSKSFKERPYFNYEIVHQYWHLYCNNKMNIGSVIWRWLCAELWLRRFIDHN
ncbi:TPA: asparagine synthase (glutamine-hydrolyzing) [bacterium]|nr:asparagine synthase (glutamine-hydrolyzing) [bacterium]